MTSRQRHSGPRPDPTSGTTSTTGSAWAGHVPRTRNDSTSAPTSDFLEERGDNFIRSGGGSISGRGRPGAISTYA
jgi:hypothetical protein